MAALRATRVLRTRQGILESSLPHIPTLGFTLAALSAGAKVFTGHDLSHNALRALLPPSDPISPHSPALFQRWDEVTTDKAVSHEEAPPATDPECRLRLAMKRRLLSNQSIQPFLADALALAQQSPGGFPGHVALLADRFASHAFPLAQGTTWYAHRARVAAIWTACELHQVRDDSPDSAETVALLNRLCDSSSAAAGGAQEVLQFMNFGVEGWRGIGKSLGL